MRITNQQKKQLSDIFRENDLNQIDFDISGNYQEFKLKFKFDYFSFTLFKKAAEEYQVTILSVDNTRTGTSIVKWGGVLHRFKNWTRQLKNELSTPNGWETFQSKNYLKMDLNDLNEKFTVQEMELTRLSLKYIKEKIKLLDISLDKLGIIEGKIRELDSKLEEMNKFDWKSLFIGTFASLIMTLGIPPESSGMLWEWIKSAFSGFKLNE